MAPPILLAVPNISEGRDEQAIAAIAQAFAGGGEMSGSVRLLDIHSDEDHHRSVFTLAGRPGELADALLRGAAAGVARIDVMSGSARAERGNGRARAGKAREAGGVHPHVGAVDVVPLVYLDAGARGAACAEALVVADRIGHDLGVPVFLYGELTRGDGGSARTRAQLRRGGVAGLERRILAARGEPRGAVRRARRAGSGGQRPDFGPPAMHPTAGATLVAAREPLVAFNLQLASPATIRDADAIAALVREGGAEGLPGVRAIGMRLSGGGAQVSMNLERPLDVPAAAALEAVRRHAQVRGAELVGLAPAAALEGFPEDVPLPDFDPARHLIENALRS
jgi:glutamate formiminotransferase/glutamate formiminotransferase/formiminotetrahydrofolate cyclodeaminase